MELRVQPGKSLIVHGPASVLLRGGRADCLGAALAEGERLTVRRFRALPIFSMQGCELSLELGGEARFEIVEGSTFTKEWTEAQSQVINLARSRGKLIVPMLGAVDCGKSTFTLHTANRLLAEGLTVNIVDADIGQSDLGPPATVGAYSPRGPLVDLASVTPDRLFFLGAITPPRCSESLLNVVSTLCRESRSRHAVTLVNTDGWVNGGEAKSFKVRLCREVNADLVVALQREGELTEILEELRQRGFRVLSLPVSRFLRQRSREERRSIREHLYLKYLQGLRLRILDLKRVRVKGVQMWDRGRLVGLEDSQGNLAGFGLVRGFVPEKRLAKIETNVRGEVGGIVLSPILIENGREIISEPGPDSDGESPKRPGIPGIG